MQDFGWGRSSVGRAAGSQSAGQGFESPRLHHPALETDTGGFERRMVSSVVPPCGTEEDRSLPVPSYGWQASSADCMMFYTYIIESINHPGNRYIGHTTDLKQRVADHNTGRCDHTAKFAPWKLKIYIAFETLEPAQHFERYLKSGSGHAFANCHFGLPAAQPASALANRRL